MRKDRQERKAPLAPGPSQAPARKDRQVRKAPLARKGRRAPPGRPEHRARWVHRVDRRDGRRWCDGRSWRHWVAGATGATGATGAVDSATLATLATQQQLQGALALIAQLRTDLQVAAAASFAALENDGVAENFVATMEAQGRDPVSAVNQVGVDLGIQVDSSTDAQVAWDEAEYAQIVHQLNSQLSVATAALAKAQAANNTYNIDHWTAVIAGLNAELASVKQGNY